jgi:hypothetical protein
MPLPADWTKSTFSDPNGGNCVEARRVDGGIEVRHSKRPDGGTIRFTDAEWAAFLAGAGNGEFDL